MSQPQHNEIVLYLNNKAIFPQALAYLNPSSDGSSDDDYSIQQDLWGKNFIGQNYLQVFNKTTLVWRQTIFGPQWGPVLYDKATSLIEQADLLKAGTLTQLWFDTDAQTFHVQIGSNPPHATPPVPSLLSGCVIEPRIADLILCSQGLGSPVPTLTDVDMSAYIGSGATGDASFLDYFFDPSKPYPVIEGLDWTPSSEFNEFGLDVYMDSVGLGAGSASFRLHS